MSRCEVSAMTLLKCHGLSVLIIEPQVKVMDGANLLLHAVKTYWEIENKVYWVLKVAFREDSCPSHRGNGAGNFACSVTLCSTYCGEKQHPRVA
jgi:hypothetical protein